MKKIISLMLVLLILSVNVIGASGFTDIEANDYYENAAVFLDGEGIITGYEDGSFRGQNNITRAEMATIVCRFLEKTSEANALKEKSFFEDVNKVTVLDR